MAAKPTTPKFVGEIWLSTDGKHTIHAKASTPEGRTAAGEWAIRAYKFIEKELGTKPQFWEEVLKKNGEKTPPKKPSEKKKQEECLHTRTTIRQVKKPGPNQGRFFRTCLDCGKFLGWVEEGGQQ